MFDLNVGRNSSDCTGYSRRDFLRVGGLSALGLTLASYFRAQASENAPVPAQRRNMNCILMWMQGGPSHIDTFDPKPDAPAEIRGEFSTIPTRMPGVRIVRAPAAAGTSRSTSCSLIRGHDPKNGSHGVADHLMMSGHRFNPALPFPCYGSVVAKERGYRDGMFPFVQLGRNIDRRFNGGIARLPRRPVQPVRGARRPERRHLPRPRPEHRRRGRPRPPRTPLRDAQRGRPLPARRWKRTTTVQARDAFYEQAHALITSPAAKRAFDLDQETDQRPRSVRPQLARPIVPAGPPADRSGRALRHRDRRRLGHARRTTSAA